MSGDPIGDLFSGAYNWLLNAANSAANAIPGPGGVPPPYSSGDVFGSGIDDWLTSVQYLIDQAQKGSTGGPLSDAAWWMVGHEEAAAMAIQLYSTLSPAQRAHLLDLAKKAQQQPTQSGMAQGAQGTHPRTGTSAAALANQAGQTATTVGGLPGISSTQMVPLPFKVQPNITNTFDPSSGEWGQDYSMDPGTPLFSPFPGTVRVVDNGKQAWGKQVFVDVKDSAMNLIGTFSVGHMTGFNVASGATIAPGQLLGWSGGAQSDPSSGNTTGPHVELMWLNASGEPVNPASMFQTIFNGADYQFLYQKGYLSQMPGGAPGFPTQTGGPSQVVYTSDYQAIQPTDPMMKYFEMMRASWVQNYGVAPPMWALQVASQQGIQNESQVTDLINQLPSDINGMNNGQRQTFDNLVQGAATKYLGYTVPMAFLQQLADQGITDPIMIDDYFKNHPASAIPKGDAATIQQAMGNHPLNYGTGPADPNQVVAVFNRTHEPDTSGKHGGLQAT